MAVGDFYPKDGYYSMAPESGFSSRADFIGGQLFIGGPAFIGVRHLFEETAFIRRRLLFVGASYSMAGFFSERGFLIEGGFYYEGGYY